MYLSEIPIQNAEMISDGVFDIMGLSNTRYSKRIVTFLEDEKYLEEAIANPYITCFITTKVLADRIDKEKYGILCVEEPRIAFFTIHNMLGKTEEYSRKNFVSQYGEKVQISPLAYIEKENVIIGNNVVIEEFVSIRGHCVIGDNCVIKSGTQIGGQGFEFKNDDDKILDVTHCGGVIIGSNVIIWPNVTIHKAVYQWDDTCVGEYSRINSNTHIDHGAKIGRQTRIGAGCVVSGRAQIGDQVSIGPNAVISNRIGLGTAAKISLGAVVTKDVPNNQRVTGNFAIEHEKFLKNLREIR